MVLIKASLFFLKFGWGRGRGY